MLILTRREGEEIQIGPDILLMVTQIDRGQVKLGIQAPRDVIVLRRELLDRPDFRPDTPQPR